MTWYNYPGVTFGEDSPIQWHGHEVKGHQDWKIPYHKLNMRGKANCRADKLAGEFMESHPQEINKHFPQLHGHFNSTTNQST